MYNILICCLFCLFYEMRIKTIPKYVQLVPEKYRSIFVRNKIAGKNTAIDGEIRRLQPNNGNTGSTFVFRIDRCSVYTG